MLKIIFLFISLTSLAYAQSSSPMNSTGSIACTMDAMICPDGTAVSRKAPNCQFEDCPVSPPAFTDKDGMLKKLSWAKRRALTVDEKQKIHNIVKRSVLEWRDIQTDFVSEASSLFDAPPLILEQSLPKKGLNRIGLSDAAWISNLEKALGKPLNDIEKQKLSALQSQKRARIWASREQASNEISQLLNLPINKVEQTWPTKIFPEDS